MKRIELLAPAKNITCAIDAIDCGADAVYMGGPLFGARNAARNSIDDIARATEYAHTFGAKLYVTLNTLLFDNEIAQAKMLAHTLVDCGVDAFIVQDMAYCRMGLNVELHASTQTNCINADRVRFFEQVGFTRAILERSLSIDAIKAIRNNTEIELEAFIYGAVCVSQSGRCFMSRSINERSGNRGECSQPCRLSYDLTDINGNAIIKGKHLLSVRDIDLSAHIGELIDTGITSFKIEGRLKDRVYLRNIVSYYRQLIDKEISVRKNCIRSSVGHSKIEFSPDPVKSFSRGASDYFFSGKHAGVASFNTPKAIGEYIGIVEHIYGNTIIVDRDNDIATGDGICFMSDNKTVGTNVNAVNGRSITVNRIDDISVGYTIYRNYNRLFSIAVEHSRIRRSIDVDIRFIFIDNGIEVSATDESGTSTMVRIECETIEAKNKLNMDTLIRSQMSKSGDTPFSIRNIEIINDIRFVPVSTLNTSRRLLLERLLSKRLDCNNRKHFIENYTAQYPDIELQYTDNVTNTLSEEFYRSHGVKNIERGLDRSKSTTGKRVMISDYCVRREIGECLLKPHTLNGELFIEHGRKRYALHFDCPNCQMSIIDES